MVERERGRKEIKKNSDKLEYIAPETKKHDPEKIVRGSGSYTNTYLSLYTECSLYYYY